MSYEHIPSRHTSGGLSLGASLNIVVVIFRVNIDESISHDLSVLLPRRWLNRGSCALGFCIRVSVLVIGRGRGMRLLSPP